MKIKLIATITKSRLIELKNIVEPLGDRLEYSLSVLTPIEISSEYLTVFVDNPETDLPEDIKERVIAEVSKLGFVGKDNGPLVWLYDDDYNAGESEYPNLSMDCYEPKAPTEFTEEDKKFLKDFKIKSKRLK